MEASSLPDDGHESRQQRARAVSLSQPTTFVEFVVWSTLGCSGFTPSMLKLLP
jgi:hypothetical protein